MLMRDASFPIFPLPYTPFHRFIRNSRRKRTSVTRFVVYSVPPSVRS